MEVRREREGVPMWVEEVLRGTEHILVLQKVLDHVVVNTEVRGFSWIVSGQSIIPINSVQL